MDVLIVPAAVDRMGFASTITDAGDCTWADGLSHAM